MKVTERYKMKKKNIRILLALAVMVAMLFATIPANAAEGSSPSGTPISTAEQLIALGEGDRWDGIEGNYYLTNDIDMAAYPNTVIGPGSYFEGTLDGNGYTIKNITFNDVSKIGTWNSLEIGLFGWGSGTIKNLTLDNVVYDLDITTPVKGDHLSAGAVVAYGPDVYLENVTVNGSMKIKLSTKLNYLHIGGLIGQTNDSNLTGCTNNMDIYVEGAECSNIYISGLMSGWGSGNIISCKNNGDITVNGLKGYAEIGGLVSSCGTGEFETEMKKSTNGGDIKITGLSGTLTLGGLFADSYDAFPVKSCKNAGDILVETKAKTKPNIVVGGLIGRGLETYVTSSGNTGKISINNKATLDSNSSNRIGGIAGDQVESISKCYNKGAITYKGNLRMGSINGIASFVTDVNQTYNIGKITVTSTNSNYLNQGFDINGIASYIRGDITKCYNSGAIKYEGKMKKGTVSGLVQSFSGACTYNYNNGKLTAPTAIKKCFICYPNQDMKYNYYTNSVGAADSYNIKSSNMKKVSAINTTTCPKLSSKYWTYSKSKKRLLLKSNKE